MGPTPSLLRRRLSREKRENNGPPVLCKPEARETNFRRGEGKSRGRGRGEGLLALPVHITQEARAHYFRVSLVYFGSFQFETPAEEASQRQY